jgi:protein arginine kinase activator
MSKKMSPIEILQRLLKEKSAHDEQIICPGCYMSLTEFKRSGRFGCSKCVNAFESYIKKLIKQIQQSDKHIGRRLTPGEKKGIEVFKLRQELKKALENEAYEEAAKIRDRLKYFGVDNVE